MIEISEDGVGRVCIGRVPQQAEEQAKQQEYELIIEGATFITGNGYFYASGKVKTLIQQNRFFSTHQHYIRSMSWKDILRAKFIK